jgi:hypothetical protein
VRPRHSDADLVDLARSGSAPAFASLLYRHRDVIQRAALKAAQPDAAVEVVMRTAVRSLRRADVASGDVRSWIGALSEQEVRSDLGRPDVERMLPADWFDRAWVRVEPSWPTGRRSRRPPRWARTVLGALLLAGLGSGATYALVTAERMTDVVSELVGEPIEDPMFLVVPGPVVDQEPEDAPELFGDVELGELPTYDLTGDGDRRRPPAPTIGPPPGTDDDAGERPAEDAEEPGPDESDED